MSLRPYQMHLDLTRKSDESYIELSATRKRVIAAYFNELEARMWHQFAKEPWTKDKDKDAARAEEIVIKLAKEMNNEWNEHREANPGSWMPHDGFATLAAVTFDIPI